MTRPALDLSVYLVTDRAACRGRALFDVVAAAVAGGVSLVQLREKHCSTRECVDLARALLAVLAPHKVPLCINDRVDVALAVGAAGVHLGQDDLDPATARRLLGPEAIIGMSVSSEAELDLARGQPVDYLGAGPVFATATKADAGEPLGLDGLAHLVRLAPVPVVAIGAVGPDNARAVMGCGVAGVAVVSAICSAEDAEAAARKLRRIVDACRAGR